MFFGSILKNIKLKKISKILGGSINMTDIQDTLDDSVKKNKALDDLYSLSKTLSNTTLHLEKYNIDKEKFKKIYGKLVLLGAGQWVGGHYAAASSLVFGFTLEYVLGKLEKSSDEDLTVPFADIPNHLREMAFNLIEYFEKGKTGKVE